MNKILLLVDNPELVEELKKESNVTFLFPLKDYTVGFNYYFSLEEMPDNSYIYLNRILDNEGIEKFKKLVDDMPSKIQGIVFDDIGILEVLKEKKSNLTKILFLNHFNGNYLSINEFLEYVDSVVVCPDITIEEIDEILLKAKRAVVLYTFGYISIMYSRRTLVTNYNEHFQVKEKNVSKLKEPNSEQQFLIIENPYGTVIYPSKPFNALELRNRKNVLYNLINTSFLKKEEIWEILHSTDNLESKYPYKYLSQKKTIIKVREEK